MLGKLIRIVLHFACNILVPRETHDFLTVHLALILSIPLALNIKRTLLIIYANTAHPE